MVEASRYVADVPDGCSRRVSREVTTSDWQVRVAQEVLFAQAQVSNAFCTRRCPFADRGKAMLVVDDGARTYPMQLPGAFPSSK